MSCLLRWLGDYRRCGKDLVSACDLALTIQHACVRNKRCTHACDLVTTICISGVGEPLDWPETFVLCYGSGQQSGTGISWSKQIVASVVGAHAALRRQYQGDALPIGSRQKPATPSA